MNTHQEMGRESQYSLPIFMSLGLWMDAVEGVIDSQSGVYEVCGKIRSIQNQHQCAAFLISAFLQCDVVVEIQFYLYGFFPFV